MKRDILINGGKLYLNGELVPLKKDGSILTGGADPYHESGVLVSACELYISGGHESTITEDEFNQLKEGAEE